MDFDCVEVRVRTLVVLRLVYGFWLCGGKCLDFGCVEVSVWKMVVSR